MPSLFDPDRIKGVLEDLTERHWVAFAATCAERLLPHYEKFSEAHRWGNASLLREVLDEVWDWLGGMSISLERFRQLELECRAIMPDTETFSTLLCSEALDACVAVCETVQLCMGSDLSHAVNAASVARDTVDMFIQERDQMDYSDAEFEGKILSDPLMVRELSNQWAVLDELASRRELDRQFTESLRLRYLGHSSIG